MPSVWQAWETESVSVVAKAKGVVQATARLLDRVAPPPVGITVLIYHRVGGGSDSAVDLPAEQFDEQMAMLASSYRVLSLAEAVDELTSPSGWAVPGGEFVESAKRGVVVTFDDGTDDFVDVAVPILVRHGIPATLYAATEFIDAGTGFPWGAAPASWAGLRDAVATGLVSVGSHTHSHRLLNRLPGGDVAEDLDRSIELIGGQLGVTPVDFAYPKAVAGSPAAEIEVRRRFRSAALARSRVNRPGRTDVHRLWRTPVQRSDDATRFAAKASGGLRLEGEARAVAARVRYRDAVT
jgi:peptidoglycan/xylan/chitin deacetylase (PgdA/CDA1 family)